MTRTKGERWLGRCFYEYFLNSKELTRETHEFFTKFQIMAFKSNWKVTWLIPKFVLLLYWNKDQIQHIITQMRSNDAARSVSFDFTAVSQAHQRPWVAFRYIFYYYSNSTKRTTTIHCFRRIHNNENIAKHFIFLLCCVDPLKCNMHDIQRGRRKVFELKASEWAECWTCLIHLNKPELWVEQLRTDCIWYWH